MKTVIVIILFAFFRSCSLPTSIPNPEFSIKSEKTLYIISTKFSTNVKFKNNLDYEVYIYNAGCGFPNFILEKFENEKWKTAGGPVCVAIAVAPTKLQNGKDFETQVSMYLESNISSGTYRMKFFIGKGKDKSIDLKYLYSNSFQLIKN